MSEHFADRLLAATELKRAPVCVGLDPVLEKLPLAVLERHNLSRPLELEQTLRQTGEPDDVADFHRRAADACSEFSLAVLARIASHVPAVKPNIAFFERYHQPGLSAYERAVAKARELGLLVIGDVKRADIGNTSAAYAAAHLQDCSHPAPDAITINPYFGYDGVGPFVEAARETNRGLFILVQTSNPSAADIQGLTLDSGATVCHRVGELVEDWATQEGLVGERGYSCIGAVVSPRDLPSTVKLREVMPHCMFLVPGFGAQGRTADEVARCFKPDDTGALVAASRSVIYAYQNAELLQSCNGDWQACVERGAEQMVEQIRRVLS